MDLTHSFFLLKVSFQTSVRQWFRESVHIPCIVAKMVMKFQMWPKEQITSNQIYSENNVVDHFLLQAVWKDNIVSDLSIIANTELGDSATHWWKRFPSPNLVLPCHGNPVTTTTSANTLPKNDLPLVDIHLCHRCQASGTKRPSNDGNRDQGLVKTAAGQDTAVKEAGMREMKQCQVASGMTPESNVEMFF